MAHVARKIRIPLNKGIDVIFECIEKEEENMVWAMAHEEEKNKPTFPFDVRMGLSDTRMSEHDFFLLEDNGKLNIETIVFEDEKEKQLYLQDFRQVRIDALEFPKIRMKHDWE